MTERLAAFNIADTIQEITDIITRMSFRHRELLKKYFHWRKVVQDADMLDAIGAAGIGRAFMFAGAKGHPMYGTQTSVLHIEDKLIKLKGLMNTKAVGLAEERHQFLLQFAARIQKSRHRQKLSGAIERLCRLC